MKILLNETIDSWKINPIIEELLNKKDKKEDIEVIINSPGGEVFAGFALYNILKNWEGKVTTEILGMACSIAAIIYLAGKEKKVYKNSMLMFHKASTFSFGGNAEELEKDAERLKNIDKILNDLLQKTTGKTEKEIDQLLSDEWFLIGAKNIKAEKLADVVIDKDIAMNKKVYAILNKKNKLEDKTKMSDEEKKKYDEEIAAIKARLDKLEEDPEEEPKKEDPEEEPKKEDPEEKTAENILNLLELAKINISAELKKAIIEKQTKESFAYNLIQSGYFNQKKDEVIGKVNTDVKKPEAPKTKEESFVNSIVNIIKEKK